MGSDEFPYEIVEFRIGSINKHRYDKIIIVLTATRVSGRKKNVFRLIIVPKRNPFG